MDAITLEEREDSARLAFSKGRKRRKAFLLFGGGLILIAACWWIWATFIAADTVSTENAYTDVEVAEVTPLVSGPVRSVHVVDTQHVHAGDVLVELDDTDLRLAVEQAEAALGRARRQVEQLEANDSDLAGQVGARAADEANARADLAKANADLDKAQLDERRRQDLAGPGAVSQQELSDSQTAVRQAEAEVAQAKAKISAAEAARASAAGARLANRALFADATIETNPEVLAAKAKLEQARVDLSRAVIRAPVDGVVDQRHVAVGQRVQAGAPLMVVVPVKHIYVDANFKEVQLSRVHAGQKARLTSDLYGGRIVYHGRVVGFAGGSGSAFAAIPAQNATGNWIKVVQRLPIRIELDPAELSKHPLRVGLSMHATVDLLGSR